MTQSSIHCMHFWDSIIGRLIPLVANKIIYIMDTYEKQYYIMCTCDWMEKMTNKMTHKRLWQHNLHKYM